MENSSSNYRMPSSFHLPNALVQGFIQDLEVHEGLPANATQRLDRLTFEVNKLVEEIHRGRVIDQSAMQDLVSRLEHVEALSQDPKFRRRLSISRIFYQKILALDLKLRNVEGVTTPSAREAIRDLKQVVRGFRQSLKSAILDAYASESDRRTPAGAVSSEDLSIALRYAMEQALGIIGPSEAELRAEGALGSKWENLIIMSYLQDMLQIPGLFIPRPVGISSPRVEAFLRQSEPNPLKAWAELCDLYHYRDASTPFLMQELVKQKIREIQQGIQTAFNQAAEDPQLYAQLATPELNEMVTSLQRESDCAIVRSTGAEDTKAAANAGGNLSIPYVPPTRAEILRAAGAVVASYFDVDSLKNRLDSGQNPFAERLQLAVLTQQMIGEPVLPPGANNIAENIPTSFVCFSGEPLWVGTEKFRIVRIVATKGNGRSVVEATGIPTDSWVILFSTVDPHRMFVVADIQKKGEREAPVQTVHGQQPVICKTENPSEIVKKPSLSSEQLRSILEGVVVMEARFGGVPTDFEGVCRKANTYFVQARPVNRPPHAANYFDIADLDERQRTALLTILQAFPIVPGRSNVVEITNPNQLVVAETLDQAEKLYHAELGHRLVVVSRPSPLLSHAVVNFSHLGVPCLRVKDMDAVINLKARIGPRCPLEVCTQTAKFYLWDQTVADPALCVKEGFGKHPAKLSPSPLSASLRLERPQETPEEIIDLLLRIRGAPTRSAGLAAIRDLENHPLVAGIQAESRRHEQIVRDHPNAPVKAREISQALSQYAAAVRRAFAESKPVFSRPDALPKEQDHLQRLFRTEVLEALLLEPLDEPGAIGRCSLMQVQPMSQAISALIAYQQQLPKPARFADLLMDVTRIPNPDPAIFHEWREFLLALEDGAILGKITPKQVGQFKAVMKSMRKAGILPMWFTFYFNSQGFSVNRLSLGRLGTSPAISMVRNLLRQFNNDAPFLAELTTRRLQINRLSGQLDRFAHPETFEEAWRELETEVANWSAVAFFGRIKAASPLAQNMAYQTMERLVTTLDTAVKTMKIGAGFTDKVQQTLLFKRMLMPYHQLMGSWALHMVPQRSIPTHQAWGIPAYVAKVEEILRSRRGTSPAQLLASDGFSVNAAVLGSHTEFDRSFPSTLEDVLTLEHQNILVFLSVLNLQSLPTNAVAASRLPTSFKQVLTIIERPAGTDRIRRVGLTVSENEIIYRGNYPLRNHSGQLELVYNKTNQQMMMRAHFMGEARERWSAISDWVQLLNDVQMLRLEGPVEIGQQEISFMWNINPVNISEAMNEFFKMGQYTLIQSGAADLLLHFQSWKTPSGNEVLTALSNYSLRHPTGTLASHFITTTFRQMTQAHFMWEAGVRWDVILDWVQILNEAQRLPHVPADVGLLVWNANMDSISKAITHFVRGEHREVEYSDIVHRLQSWNVQNNHDVIIAVSNFAFRNPDNPLARHFVVNAFNDESIGLLESVPRAYIKDFAAYCLRVNFNSFLDRFMVLVDRGVISRGEFSDIVGPHCTRIMRNRILRVLDLAEGPITEATAVPTLKQIRSSDFWVSHRSLYVLDALVEQGNTNAIALAIEIVKAPFLPNFGHCADRQWVIPFILKQGDNVIRDFANCHARSLTNTGTSDSEMLMSHPLAYQMAFHAMSYQMFDGDLTELLPYVAPEYIKPLARHLLCHVEYFSGDRGIDMLRFLLRNKQITGTDIVDIVQSTPRDRLTPAVMNAALALAKSSHDLNGAGGDSPSVTLS